MTETPVPFPDCLGWMRLPYPLAQDEADRIKGMLDALVVPAKEEQGGS